MDLTEWAAGWQWPLTTPLICVAATMLTFLGLAVWMLSTRSRVIMVGRVMTLLGVVLFVTLTVGTVMEHRNGTLADQVEAAYPIRMLTCQGTPDIGRLQGARFRSQPDGITACTWIDPDGRLVSGHLVKQGLTVTLYDADGMPVTRE